MTLTKIVMCIFAYMHIISANVTRLTTEEIGTSELSMCENSTNDCYSDTTTDQVPLYISDSPTTELEAVSDVTTEIKLLVTFGPTPSHPLSENKKKDNSAIEKLCNCDITAALCNVNCCCDPDCSKWERDAFSECITPKPVPTSGLCLSTGIIYKNNTPYPVVKSEDGLLCISKDNFPERNRYLEQGIIKSDNTFEKLWHRKKRYYWKKYHPPLFIKFLKSDTYKYGDPLWVFFNATNSVQQLTYPASLASSMCSQEKIVLYLQNFESNCLESIPLNEEQCLHNGLHDAGKYYNGRILIASPSLINNTYNLEESPDEAFITIKYELCRGSTCFPVDKYPVPEFNPVTNKCQNVLKSIYLDVRHNGSKGITEARYQVSMTSTGPQQLLFQRTFKVQFLPARQSNMPVVFRRSGTPGYRVGLPVITGSLKGDRVVKKSYLTVISGPNCSESTKVLFGENSRTQCVLQVPVESTRNCTHLKEQVIKLMMLQMNGEVIGTSGDPDTWLKRPVPAFDYPVQFAAQDPCSIPTSLSLDFLYSYSGSLWQPTANIIGVSSSLAGEHFIDCSNSMFFCHLRLISIISFTDVSQPAVSKFATPPVVKIKLPCDFFYPFSSSASCPSVHNTKGLLILFIFNFSILLYQCGMFRKSLIFLRI